MHFEFSPHIAFQVDDYPNAVRFYQDVMGMTLVKAGETETALSCGPITFYVESGMPRKLFLEFKTGDLAEAKELFRQAGCKLEPSTTPEGFEGCYVTDPYGLLFHIWHEKASEPPDAQPSLRGDY